MSHQHTDHNVSIIIVLSIITVEPFMWDRTKITFKKKILTLCISMSTNPDQGLDHF